MDAPVLDCMSESKHPHPIRTSVIRKSTGKTWTDPRKEGEALRPNRFSLKSLQRIAKDQSLSSHMAAGQLQQRPSAREGGLFEREWFANPAKFIPEGLELVRSWDFASSVQASNDPDWTVGLLMGREPHSQLIYILDVIRARLSPGPREQRVKSTALFDGDEVRIRIRKTQVVPENLRHTTSPASCRATRFRWSQSMEQKRGAPTRSPPNANKAWSSWSRAPGTGLSLKNYAPSPTQLTTIRLTPPRLRFVRLYAALHGVWLEATLNCRRGFHRSYSGDLDALYRRDSVDLN